MAHDDDIEEWLQRVIDAIEAHGGARKAISIASGLGPTFIRDLVDRRQIPTVEKLQKLCTYLGVEMATLFASEPKSSEDIAHELQNTALRRVFREVDALPRNIQKVILEGLGGQVKIAKAGDKQPVRAKSRERVVTRITQKTG